MCYIVNLLRDIGARLNRLYSFHAKAVQNNEEHSESCNTCENTETPEKTVELLLKQHTNEQAIDITIENLAKELSKHNKTGDGWSEEIDELLQVLDLIQPLDQGDTYSHIANPEMLAEIATIDYEKIADAISQFTKMAHNADIRMQAILAIMTNPAMKVQADKLYHRKQLYKDTINCLQKLQNKLPDTFCVDDNKVMASSKMYIIDGKVFGFICDGKMYCPNTGYSKALLHLYTYVWMKHHKRVNIGLYDTIYNYVVTTDYFHHILSSPRFSDLDYEEAAIKAYCYMVAFDGTEIYFDEKKKQELLERHSDDVIFYDKEELIRLPLLSIINKSIDLSATLKTL